MPKSRSEALLWISTALGLSLSSVLPPEAFAQTRALPKANFNNYSNNGGNALPSGAGLSLQEGMDRPRGAPAEVYNPGEPSLGHKLVRWEPRFMPLRVWISPGKKLKDEAISIINQNRPQEVLALLRSDPALSSLEQCSNWNPEMSSAAAVGIEQWKEFQNEGLLAFDFVDDPSQANILLFWTDGFTGDEGVGGVSTGGNTVAVLYDAKEVHAKEALAGGRPLQGTPVIIELRAADSFDKLQARAAHEFGHALGIKAHSPYNQDLMCVNGIAKQLSGADKATIRWLYRQQTPLLMLPPALPKYSAPVENQQPAYNQVPGQSPDDQSQYSGQQYKGYGQMSGRPGAGYKIPVNRTTKYDLDDGGESSTGPRTATGSTNTGMSGDAERGETKKHREKEKDKDKDKNRERKSKTEKNSDTQTSASSPDYSSTPAVPKTKASDGY